MTTAIRAFLDTSTVKHSIRSRTVTQPMDHTPNINGQTHVFRVHKIIEIDPANSVDNPVLKAEIDLIDRVAQHAKNGDLELLWNVESELEFFGIARYPGGGKSTLVEAGITMVPAPIAYSRPLSSLNPFSKETGRSLRTDFLNALDHRRFIELKSACGALQGKRVVENQLLDAFHIWCAESAGASHFLTTDFKLVRLVRGHRTSPPRVKVVVPSELLGEVESPQAN